MTETVSHRLEAAAARLLEQGGGVLRLAPTWVPRAFGTPGRRLKLHPDDYQAFGQERGPIVERWLATAVRADNGPLTGAHEGVSRAVGPEGEKVPLDLLVGELRAELIGPRLWEAHGAWPVAAKFFDYGDSLPLHVHHSDEKARLVDRPGKDEAYYFPAQMNSHLGSTPMSFFGLRPEVRPDRVREFLSACGRRGDTPMTCLSMGFRLELETGWDIPAGILHAPGSLCTYEVQSGSDVMAMFECWKCGGPDLLFKDVPSEHKGDLDFALSLLDWPANTDPDFSRNRFMAPVRSSAGHGLQESWIIYRSASFSAKRLVIPPGVTSVVRDQAAYGCIAIQGYGMLGKWQVETPTLIRFGETTSDEFFVSEAAARDGLRMTNLSATEPLVMLKHFGPGNPELDTALQNGTQRQC